MSGYARLASELVGFLPPRCLTVRFVGLIANNHVGLPKSSLKTAENAIREIFSGVLQPIHCKKPRRGV
jgi:hypothetical protein